MKMNQVKLALILAITVPLLAVYVFNQSVTTYAVAADDVAAVYKAKCAMCHKAEATKHFDPEKSDEVLIEITLKGMKGEKPPYMPGFEAKGMTSEQAAELVAYMKGFHAAEDTDSANSNTESNESADVDESADVSDEALAAAAATYKTKCSLCHKPKAEKYYDPEMALDEQIEAILMGKKGEKPPYMPAFESKGIDANQAKALSVYMKNLRAAE